MHRRRFIAVTGAVRNREARAVHVERARVEAQLEAEQAEKRNHPGIARNARRQVVFGQREQAPLKYAPQRSRIGERGGDFVAEVALRIKTEIGGLLSRQIGSQKLIERARPEQSAFDADGGKNRHQLMGCSTRSPSKSGGNCGATVKLRTGS